MINSVSLVGRVGNDPELKYFESGSVKARLSLAVDRNFSRENRITDWFNIEVWGKQAEFVGEWVKKGALIAVDGTLNVNRWTDQAGNAREFPVVKASSIRFVGSKRDSNQSAHATTF